MRILVLRGGALGDLLVTLPALALLRQRWPDARIELAGNLPAATLAVNRGLLDHAHSQHEARWSALYGTDPLPAAFADWLGDFDLVVSFWPDPQQELSRRFPRQAGQQFITASALPATTPAAVHFCTALHPLGLEPGAVIFPLRAPVAGSSAIALHPGSGSPHKNWPADRWSALARWLRRERGFDLVAICGEAEPPALLGDEATVLRERPLDEVADCLARCRLFLGHDSGISHLAAATGVPSVLLFGPTDPAVWAPPAPTVSVLQRGAELGAISLADVQQVVAAALSRPG